MGDVPALEDRRAERSALEEVERRVQVLYPGALRLGPLLVTGSALLPARPLTVHTRLVPMQRFLPLIETACQFERGGCFDRRKASKSRR
jgi:hypothetical protein